MLKVLPLYSAFERLMGRSEARLTLVSFQLCVKELRINAWTPFTGQRCRLNP